MERVLIILAILVVAGCKLDITSELYVSDLRLVLENKSELMTPAMIAIDIPSANACDEYTTRVDEIMEGVLEQYETRGCTNEGMESKLLMAVQAPILESSSSDTLLYIGVRLVEEGEMAGKMAVYVGLDPRRYRLFQERVQNEFYQEIDLKESEVRVTLHNDERAPITYWVVDAFLNGNPVHRRQAFELVRRQTTDIVLSNVGAANLAVEGTSLGLLIDL